MLQNNSKVEIPASALYYKRQLEGSPVTISVFPGEIDATSTSISGEGLVGCVAMEEVGAWIHRRQIRARVLECIQLCNVLTRHLLVSPRGILKWLRSFSRMLTNFDKHHNTTQRRVRRASNAGTTVPVRFLAVGAKRVSHRYFHLETPVAPVLIQEVPEKSPRQCSCHFSVHLRLSAVTRVATSVSRMVPTSGT